MLERLGLLVKICLLILIFSFLFPVWVISSDHDTREIEWLAWNVYHESRGEGDLGVFAVALVTTNRADSDLFPNTISEVVTQPGQFSWYWDDKPDIPQEPEAYQACSGVSKFVYGLWKRGTIKNILVALNLDGVKWYHNNTVSPAWVFDYQYVGQTKNHLFYRDS